MDAAFKVALFVLLLNTLSTGKSEFSSFDEYDEDSDAYDHEDDLLHEAKSNFFTSGFSNTEIFGLKDLFDANRFSLSNVDSDDWIPLKKKTPLDFQHLQDTATYGDILDRDFPSISHWSQDNNKWEPITSNRFSYLESKSPWKPIKSSREYYPGEEIYNSHVDLSIPKISITDVGHFDSQKDVFFDFKHHFHADDQAFDHEVFRVPVISAEHDYKSEKPSSESTKCESDEWHDCQDHKHVHHETHSNEHYDADHDKEFNHLTDYQPVSVDSHKPQNPEIAEIRWKHPEPENDDSRHEYHQPVHQEQDVPEDGHAPEQEIQYQHHVTPGHVQQALLPDVQPASNYGEHVKQDIVQYHGPDEHAPTHSVQPHDPHAEHPKIQIHHSGPAEPEEYQDMKTEEEHKPPGQPAYHRPPPITKQRIANKNPTFIARGYGRQPLHAQHHPKEENQGQYHHAKVRIAVNEPRHIKKSFPVNPAPFPGPNFGHFRTPVNGHTGHGPTNHAVVNTYRMGGRRDSTPIPQTQGNKAREYRHPGAEKGRLLYNYFNKHHGNERGNYEERRENQPSFRKHQDGHHRRHHPEHYGQHDQRFTNLGKERIPLLPPPPPKGKGHEYIPTQNSRYGQRLQPNKAVMPPRYKEHYRPPTKDHEKPFQQRNVDFGSFPNAPEHGGGGHSFPPYGTDRPKSSGPEVTQPYRSPHAHTGIIDRIYFHIYPGGVGAPIHGGSLRRPNYGTNQVSTQKDYGQDYQKDYDNSKGDYVEQKQQLVRRKGYTEEEGGSDDDGLPSSSDKITDIEAEDTSDEIQVAAETLEDPITETGEGDSEYSEVEKSEP